MHLSILRKRQRCLTIQLPWRLPHWHVLHASLTWRAWLHLRRGGSRIARGRPRMRRSRQSSQDQRRGWELIQFSTSTTMSMKEHNKVMWVNDGIWHVIIWYRNACCIACLEKNIFIYQTLTANPIKPPMMAIRVHTKLIHDSQNAAGHQNQNRIRS